jgi:hypothetical protein
MASDVASEWIPAYSRVRIAVIILWIMSITHPDAKPETESAPESGRLTTPAARETGTADSAGSSDSRARTTNLKADTSDPQKLANEIAAEFRLLSEWQEEMKEGHF